MAPTTSRTRNAWPSLALAAALLPFLGAGALPAAAQVGGAHAPPLRAAASAGPVAALIPGAAAAPAPEWVRPGMRLTYYAASASVAGSGRDWKIDPEGNFQTPDGRRWSGAEKIGASGQGFTHYDVVAVNSRETAISTATFIAPPGAAPSSAGTAAFMGAPGATGDIWVNPAALSKLPARAQGGVRLSRAPYNMGGSARPALWIYTTTVRGYTLYVYELATGVLLHYSASTSGSPSGVVGSDEVSNTPNTQLVTTTLVARRSLNLPWAADPVPSWVSTVRSLSYSGTITTFIPGSPRVSLPIASTMSVAARGSGWVRFAVQTSSGGAGGLAPSVSQSESLSGPASMGAWISPAGLARLRAGQQLDRDPATGVVAVVAGSSRTPRGSEMIVISLKNAAEQTDLGYDRSTGMLVYISLVQRVPPATNQTQLYLQSAQ